MRRAVWIIISLFQLSVFAGMAGAKDCYGLPTSFTGDEFPNGDFFSNFDNDCYTIRLGAGNGTSKYGDLGIYLTQVGPICSMAWCGGISKESERVRGLV